MKIVLEESLRTLALVLALVVPLSHADGQEERGSGTDSAARTSEGGDASGKRRELHLYMKGRYVFEKHCVDCHGATGRGNGPWAEELETKPRNFRSGLFKFRTTPYGKLPVSEDIRRTIRSGISGTAMPFFTQLLDEDVDALVVFLQSLSRSWNDPALHAEPLVIPEVPGWFVSGEARAEHAARGGVRFAELCSVCHGAAAKGDGEGGLHLLDAWDHPVRPANLAFPQHKSGDSPRDLYRSIATGLNGTPMIGYAEVLDEEEIWSLVAFIRVIGEKSSP